MKGELNSTSLLRDRVLPSFGRISKITGKLGSVFSYGRSLIVQIVYFIPIYHARHGGFASFVKW